MTDQEKAVIMAYTGYVTLKGDKFSIYHKYVEELLKRPVYTHELGDIILSKQIKALSRDDFIAICNDEFE